jgi:hypothetical protein
MAAKRRSSLKVSLRQRNRYSTPLHKGSRSWRKESIPSSSKRLSLPAFHTLTFSSIVAVHGLNGHRDKTWTAANGVHWLRDLLPTDLPHARIFCWGYDANTHGDRVSCQYLYDHARSLVADLCLERRLTNVGFNANSFWVSIDGGRPQQDLSFSWHIVWVALSSRVSALRPALGMPADCLRP